MGSRYEGWRCSTASPGAIAVAKPDTIVFANTGCICHLPHGTGTPVRHWFEAVDATL